MNSVRLSDWFRVLLRELRSPGGQSRGTFLFIALFLLAVVSAFVMIHTSSRETRAPATLTDLVRLLRSTPTYGNMLGSLLRRVDEHPALGKQVERTLRNYHLRQTRQGAAPSEYRLTFPHTANGTSGSFIIKTRVAIINNGGADATGHVILHKSDGTPLVATTNLGMGSEFPFELNSGGTLELRVQPEGTAQTGWIEVVSDVELSGSGVFTIEDQSGNFLSQTGIPDSVRASRLMLFVDIAGEKNTGFAVANPNSGQTANLTLTLKSLQGTEIATRQVELGSLEQINQFVTETFASENLANFKGVLIIDSDVPISVVTLRTRGINFTSLPAVPPPGEDDNDVLHFARIGDGIFGDLIFTTAIILLNNSMEDISATVEFLDQEGKPLSLEIGGEKASLFDVIVPAGCAVELISDGSTNPGSVGWARVTSDQPLAGSATFTIETAAEHAFLNEVGVPSSSLDSQPALLVRERSGVSTALAITNTDEAPIRLRIRLQGRAASDQNAPAGTAAPDTVFAEIFRDLPPFSHIGLFVDQLFPDVPEVANRNFDGHLEVEAFASDFGEEVLLPVASLTLLANGLSLTSLPVANYKINFGPNLSVVPATDIQGVSPALCLKFRQFDGEIPFDFITVLLEGATADFSNAQEAEPLGQSYGELLFFQFWGDNYATELQEQQTDFYYPTTFDGVSDSLPLIGTIRELPGEGVEVLLDNNSPTISPYPVTATSKVCFDGGLIRLPESNSHLAVSVQAQSQEQTAGQTDFLLHTRHWESPLHAAGPGPRIETTNPRRASAGEEVEILGSGFSSTTGNNRVTVEGNSRVEAEILSVADDRLLVRLPANVTSGPLRVETGGSESNSYSLEIAFAPVVQMTVTGEASNNVQLEIEVSQQSRELAFESLLLQPNSGNWLDQGFDVDEVVGTWNTRAPFSDVDRVLKVTATEGGTVTLGAFQEGVEDADFLITLTQDQLLLTNPSAELASVVPSDSVHTISFSVPVFQFPQGTGEVSMAMDLRSSYELAMVPSSGRSISRQITLER